MKCIDCKYHDCVVGTHFCNFNKNDIRRISEQDAKKDVPCKKTIDKQ